MEQPTYHRMNRLLIAQGLDYQTIDEALMGLTWRNWKATSKQEKLSFSTPFLVFTILWGIPILSRTNETILDLAAKYGVYIVEDDYLGDLDSKKGQTFHYLDTEERVIYIKSFSTSLFPALRITALILPNAIKEAFVAYKNILDYDSNLIMQKALSLYIAVNYLRKIG